jgi:phosphate-selective porin OprO/OprP
MKSLDITRCGGWGVAVALLLATSTAVAADGPATLFPANVLPALVIPPPAGEAAPGTEALPGVVVSQPPAAALPPVPAPTPAPSPAPSGGGPGADGVPLQDRWRNGLRFESADKNFSLFVGGRFQFDVVNYLATQTLRQNIPGTTPLDDGVSFRRIRFDMGGTIYKNIEFYAQVDFANGFLAVPGPGSRVTNATYPTDVWVAFKDLPVIGNVRVGNQKPLYSFEHLTSSRFLNFLERSLGFDAFAEGFNNGFEPGITAYDTYAEKRGTWGFGVFKNTRSPFGWNVGRNEAEVNGRVTYLPIYEDDGRVLLHVGVGGASRDAADGPIRARARLDARNSPSAFSSLVADTGLFGGSQQQLLIPELAGVWGPLSFQSEYYGSWIQNAETQTAAGVPIAHQGTVYLWSWYAEAHLFLTGEHREYSRDAGVFTRVVPNRPLAWTRSGFTGCGAWQLTARYTYLDLNDKDIHGGRVNDMTLGMNWFLNPNMKVQWNYFLAGRDAPGTAGDGLIHGFATRLAIDF